jgi:hypothetical protein
MGLSMSKRLLKLIPESIKATAQGNGLYMATADAETDVCGVSVPLTITIPSIGLDTFNALIDENEFLIDCSEEDFRKMVAKSLRD